MSAAGAAGPRAARLLEREDLTRSLAFFRLAPEDGPLSFEAGQYVTIGLPRPDDPARVLWRPYSIASPPEEERQLELLVRRAVRPVAGELTSLLWELAPGERVLLRPAKGTFTVDATRPDGTPETRRLLLLAGGTGLAPFASVVRHLRAAGSTREVVLGHGASYAVELAHRALFEELARESAAGGADWRFHYLPTVSRPTEPANAGWHGLVGRVESLVTPPAPGLRSAVESAVGDDLAPETTVVHVCGFAGTVAAALAVLEPLGFRTRRDARADGTYDVKVESYG